MLTFNMFMNVTQYASSNTTLPSPDTSAKQFVLLLTAAIKTTIMFH